MHIIREVTYDLLLGHQPEAMHCNKTLVKVSSEQGLTKTIQKKKEKGRVDVRSLTLIGYLIF